MLPLTLEERATSALSEYAWKEIYCVTDEKECIAVVTFDTRGAGDFCTE